MKKNEKRLLFIIIIVAYLTIGIIAGLAITILTSDSYSKTSIKLYKERCYDIYNEGIVKTQECLGYDNININSSSHEDQNILYNQGLKYVEHLDLMEFELFNTIKEPFKDEEIPYEKIKFTKKEFLIYDGRKNPFYLRITVDREHIDDMNMKNVGILKSYLKQS